MRVLIHECRKLLNRQILWVIALCLLLANGCLVFLKTGDRMISPDLYRSFFSEISDMTLSETQMFIETELENTMNETNRYPAMFLYSMKEQAETVAGYSDYLEMISAQKNSMSTLFNAPGTFSYRNIQKTPDAYENVRTVSPIFDVSEGIELALDSPVTDVIAIFLVFFFTVNIMLKDRESGCIRLLFTFRHGRIPLFLNQLSLAVGIAIMTTLLFFGENLLIGSMTYGLGDLSRPIQSVNGYISCNLSLSVVQYLGLFLVEKTAAYVLLTVFFGLVCCFAKNNLVVYGVTGGFLSVSMLTYKLIPETSPLSLFHYWNPILFTQSNEIFSGYKNVNLFGFPVSLKISVMILLLTGIIFFTSLGAFLFAKLKNKDYRTYSLPLPKFQNRVHGRWYYTLHKSLVLRKGMLLIGLLCIVIIGMQVSFSHPYSNEEIQYYNFTTDLEGRTYDDAVQFVEGKLAHYAEVEEEIAVEQQLETPNAYRISVLTFELNDRRAVLRLQKRLDAMAASDCENDIFYDTGYERLFGFDGGSADILYVIILTLFLGMLLSPQIVSDRKMQKIIHSTRTGRRYYLQDNLLFGGFSGVFASVLLSVPYAVQMLQSYGTQGLFEPIQSIGGLTQFPVEVSVLTFLLLILFWRVLAAVLCSFAMLGISALSKNTMTAIMINLAVFTLPATLYFVGLEQMALIGATPLLSGIRLII